MKASELEPGRIYRRTTRAVGMPNSYYVVMEAVPVRRLEKRLRKKGLLTLKAEDARVLAAINRGDVIVEGWHRYTASDKSKQEFRTRFGIGQNANPRLREVKAKPGYVTKAMEAAA